MKISQNYMNEWMDGTKMKWEYLVYEEKKISCLMHKRNRYRIIVIQMINCGNYGMDNLFEGF